MYVRTINAIALAVVAASLLLQACPMQGQARVSKKLVKQDFHRWGELTVQSLSDDGQWAGYRLGYEDGNDTLFVRNVRDGRTFSFPKGTEGRFMGEGYFGCLASDGSFSSTDLASGQIFSHPDVEQFGYLDKTKQIVLYCKSKNLPAQILINNRSGKNTKAINEAKAFAFSPRQNSFAAVTASGDLLLYNERSASIETVGKMGESRAASRIVWDAAGTHFLFFYSNEKQEGSAGGICFYRLGDRKLFKLDTGTAREWPENRALEGEPFSLAASRDGKRVLFSVIGNAQGSEDANPDVEIWNARDSYLLPYRTGYGDAASNRSMMAWLPDSGAIHEIGEKKMQAVQFSGTSEHALLADTAPYLPTAKYGADADYYIQKIGSGKKELVAAQLDSEMNCLQFSPDGRYLAYFKDKDFYLYDIPKKTASLIRPEGSISFTMEPYDRPGGIPPYGIAGWSRDGRKLLFYDKFDLWAYDLNRKGLKRVTDGRDNGIRFRVAYGAFEQGASSWIRKTGRILDLKKGVLLEARRPDYSESGFFSLEPDGRVKKLVFGDRKFTGAIGDRKGTTVIYISEDSDVSPMLEIYEKAAEGSRVLFRSNPQDSLYGWSRSELIRYKNSRGEHLKGVLAYPFDYDPSKKYPMIVYVYETQGHMLHSYSRPTMANSAGFNRTVFASQGYFILYPDIAYEIGNPGFSAADCVIAATREAIGNPNIDSTRIGITGTSFGGYETTFIIGQTDMFRAAASGASITDLTSSYLSLGINYSRPEFWRFENDQTRMGKPLHEDLKGYAENSPVRHAAKIKTPLLAYAGGKDGQVNKNQSMELYMALRRLGKEHVMLVYPEEEHVLHKFNNQEDLTERLLQWFAHHLKDDRLQPWMVPK